MFRKRGRRSRLVSDGGRIGRCVQFVFVNMEKCTKNLVENDVEFVENSPCDLDEIVI